MPAQPPDWPKVLSLAVHEFRTPLTVVAGYLRMLSTDRVGPLSEAQRRVIEEAERSCARMSSLLTEVSDVAHFHQGRLSFLKSAVPLSEILTGLGLSSSDRPLRLIVEAGEAANATVEGDAGRLRQALTAVATAMARETIESDQLYLLAETRDVAGVAEVFMAIGSEPVARAVLQADMGTLPAFDSGRGGSGLSLIVARQIIEDHGGRLFGAPGDRARAGAGIALPRSS